MDGILQKLPFDHKDVMAIALFIVCVALAVIVAKKLPVIGSKV